MVKPYYRTTPPKDHLVPKFPLLKHPPVLGRSLTLAFPIVPLVPTTPFPVRAIPLRPLKTVPAILQIILLERLPEIISTVRIVIAGIVLVSPHALDGILLRIQQGHPLTNVLTPLRLTGMTIILLAVESFLIVFAGAFVAMNVVLTPLLRTLVADLLKERLRPRTLLNPTLRILRTRLVPVVAFELGVFTEIPPFPKLLIDPTLDPVAAMTRTALGQSALTVSIPLIVVFLNTNPFLRVHEVTLAREKVTLVPLLPSAPTPLVDVFEILVPALTFAVLETTLVNDLFSGQHALFALLAMTSTNPGPLVLLFLLLLLFLLPLLL